MNLNLHGVPPKLYKYFSPERVDVLTQKSFRYTPLGEFNDPFEGRPHVDGLTSEDKALALFEECLPDELENGFKGLPEEIKAHVSKEDYLNLMLPAMRANKATLLSMLSNAGSTIISNLPNQLDQKMGALCLSEICDSLLMWAHYGNSHSGFVIEFNSHHPYFHQQAGVQDELRHLRRVLYRETRPSGMLTDLEGSDVFLVKSSHWTYEREWRIFRPLSDADKVIPTSSGKLYLYQIPSEAITGIVFGARTPLEFRNSTLNLIKSTADLSHINIRTCFADPKEFAIRIRDGAN